MTSFPSTSAQLTSTISNYDSNSLNMVFIYDTGALTMLSKRQIEVSEKQIEQEHAEFRVDCFSDTVKILLSENGLNDSEKEVITIEDVVDDGTDSSKTMVAKYDSLKMIYNSFSNSTRYMDITTTPNSQELIWLGHRWEIARKCLRLVAKRSDESNSNKYANIVLCADGFAHGAIELSATAMSSYIPLENIYSTATRSTQSILEMIQKKFGEQCKLVVVTSNKETIEAAVNLRICVQQINCNDDFNKLYTLQRNVWLSREPTPHIANPTATTVDNNNNLQHAHQHGSIHKHNTQVLRNVRNQTLEEPPIQHQQQLDQNPQPTMPRRRHQRRYHPYYESYYYYYHHNK